MPTIAPREMIGKTGDQGTEEREQHHVIALFQPLAISALPIL